MMRPGDRAGPNADATGQPAAGDWRTHVRRGLAALVLLGCVLFGLTRLPPAPTTDAVAALSRLTLRLASTVARRCEGPHAPAYTNTVTLAVHRDIESLLDGYGPLLRADTPLLQGPQRTEGHAANDAESWVLPSTAGRVSPACARLLHRSHDCQPSLEDACRRLTRNLMPAAENHRRVARSLAGPQTAGLWLSHVQAPLLGLVWRLDEIDAEPRRLTVPGSDDAGPQQATDGAADHDPRRRTAMLMREYVDRQSDPQRSANGEIRRALLSLREKCASIAADIRLISDASASDGACVWAELSPLAGQVEQLVSAVDDNLAALDAADDALLRLGRWLKRMPSGYLDADEVVGGSVVRTRFELPAPSVISRAVAARLERMRDDASALQQGWIAPQRLATGFLGT